MKIELFQNSTAGRLKHLIIEANGNKLKTKWWTSKDGVPGKAQETEETILGKNTGKANETSDESQCVFEFDRKVKKKKDEGYVESLSEANTKEEFDIAQPLTKEFAPSKPISKLDEDTDPFDGSWLAERKLNGVCLLIHNTGKKTVVYSRRVIDITDIVTVVPAVQSIISKIPAGSLFIGELLAAKNGKESTKPLKAVTNDRTTRTKAVERFAEDTRDGYKFRFSVYDVLFYKGQDVTKKPFLERLAITESIFEKRDIEPFTKKAEGQAKKDGWEGFILRKPDSTIEYTLNGKPKRRGGYKYKFIKETDCIVTGLVPGAGKHENRFYRFKLAQYDEGKLVDCGFAGGGKLGEKDCDELTAEILAKGYPLEDINLKEKDWFVVELEYQSRQDENEDGKLAFEFPVILRTRNDKPLKECEVE